MAIKVYSLMASKIKARHIRTGKVLVIPEKACHYP